MAGKFHQLETKFQEQESTLRIFEKQIQDNLNKNSEHPPLTQNALPRTCQAARAANSFLTSGLYWIDPDGSAAGDEPIRVYCNMNTGESHRITNSCKIYSAYPMSYFAGIFSLVLNLSTAIQRFDGSITRQRIANGSRPLR